MRLPHFGSFWNEIRPEFPVVEHALPLAGPDGEAAVDAATQLPLPRVWYIGSSGNELIQLQSDRLHFNWRRRKENGEYPRFGSILERFVGHLATFCRVIQQNGLGQVVPTSLELLYVNHLTKDAAPRAVAEYSEVLSRLLWDKSDLAFLPPPTRLVWTLNFDLPPDNGKLIASLKSALSREDNMHLLILELTARGAPKDLSLEGIRRWFELAHEWIVRGFEDLTSKSAQQGIWGRDAS